jgi:hypothetical protein
MKSLLAIVMLMTSVAAFAQKSIVSIDAFDLSYTGGLLIKSDNGKKGVKDRDETNFRFNLNYAQNLEPYIGLMWKAKFFYNREDVDWASDSLYSSFGGAGGFLYNFQAEDIKNSFFAGAMLGLERATIDIGPNDESGFNFFADFEGGRRWDMGRYAKINISYAPSVAFTWKRYGGGIRDELFKTGTELKLNFLKFDILF